MAIPVGIAYLISLNPPGGHGNPICPAPFGPMDGPGACIHLVSNAVKGNGLYAFILHDIAHLHHSIQREFIPGGICAVVHLVHHIRVAEPLLNHAFELVADFLGRSLRQHQHCIGNDQPAPWLGGVRPGDFTPTVHIHAKAVVHNGLIGIFHPLVDQLCIFLPQIPLGPCQHMEQQRRICQAHQAIPAVIRIEHMLDEGPVRVIPIPRRTVLEYLRHGFSDDCKIGLIFTQNSPVHMRTHAPGGICTGITCLLQEFPGGRGVLFHLCFVKLIIKQDKRLAKINGCAQFPGKPVPIFYRAVPIVVVLPHIGNGVLNIRQHFLILVQPAPFCLVCQGHGADILEGKMDGVCIHICV